jgi:hypothetical protein
MINPNIAFKNKHSKPIKKHMLSIKFSKPKVIDYRCKACSYDFKVEIDADVEFYPNAVECQRCESKMTKWFMPS